MRMFKAWENQQALMYVCQMFACLKEAILNDAFFSFSYFRQNHD